LGNYSNQANNRDFDVHRDGVLRPLSYTGKDNIGGSPNMTSEVLNFRALLAEGYKTAPESRILFYVELSAMFPAEVKGRPMRRDYTRCFVTGMSVSGAADLALAAVGDKWHRELEVRIQHVGSAPASAPMFREADSGHFWVEDLTPPMLYFVQARGLKQVKSKIFGCTKRFIAAANDEASACKRVMGHLAGQSEYDSATAYPVCKASPDTPTLEELTPALVDAL
jgi:hypothetical protein